MNTKLRALVTTYNQARELPATDPVRATAAAALVAYVAHNQPR